MYNGELGYLSERENSNIMNESVRACEDECNQRFMSLVPIDNDWIDDGVTIYSRPSALKHPTSSPVQPSTSTYKLLPTQ